MPCQLCREETMAAANKTGPTAADVGAFVAALTPEQRRADAETLCAMLARVTGQPPVLWGPSIIGFGAYHYRYESGRTGSAPRLGFSPRKPAHVFYMTGDFPEHAALLARLGKHSGGVSCLYVKRLSDIDMGVLEALAQGAWRAMAAKYPEG
jgi:hypothetical protein